MRTNGNSLPTSVHEGAVKAMAKLSNLNMRRSSQSRDIERMGGCKRSRAERDAAMSEADEHSAHDRQRGVGRHRETEMQLKSRRAGLHVELMKRQTPFAAHAVSLIYPYG